MKKFLVINGVNLNMLGVREPEVYGSATLNTLYEQIRKKADELNCQVDFVQSNYEAKYATKSNRHMVYMTV